MHVCGAPCVQYLIGNRDFMIDFVKTRMPQLRSAHLSPSHHFHTAHVITDTTYRRVHYR